MSLCAFCRLPVGEHALYCHRCGNTLSSRASTISYGSFTRRAAALAIDYAVLSFAVSPIALQVPVGEGPLLNVLFLKLAATVPFTQLLSVFYHALLNASPWQGSVGKHLLGLRVTSYAHVRLKWKASFLREILRIASILSYGVGYLWAIRDARHRTFHDMLAKTVVVRAAPNHPRGGHPQI
ncbi:MAG: RDD family protein [Bryobacterales bacterium]|nr:RDD family protein [Bryobacterales bacterium]